MQVDTDRAFHIGGHACARFGQGHVATPLTARDILRRDVDAYIDGHLGDEDLGSTSLAHRFRLSRATLYRLFEDRGGVARHIRERRLQAAARHLTGTSPPRLTWLLHELGFASERQFQRAFRARFGMCPTHWRKRVLHGKEPPLPNPPLLCRGGRL